MSGNATQPGFHRDFNITDAPSYRYLFADPREDVTFEKPKQRERYGPC